MPTLTDLRLEALAKLDCTYVDLFDEVTFGPYTMEELIKRTYTSLAKEVHPDKPGGSKELFQRLNRLKDEALHQAAAGCYGQPVTLAVMRTKKAEHQVRLKRGEGDIASLYETTTITENGEMTGFLKVARTPKDNDLLTAEARALKKLHVEDDQLTRHFPLLLDTFLAEGRRKANVTQFQTDCITLADVHKVYPALEPVHAVWIWRRVLMALGYAHQQGVLHGAIVPEHILIYPEQHGVILVDWCYSQIAADTTDSFANIKAIPSGYKDWYPAEVLDKEPPTTATDICLAAKTMIWALGGDVTTREMPGSAPSRLRAFLRGCTQPHQAMRPDNAWVLLQEFDDMLKRLGEPFYPRRWVDFTMPSGT